MLLLAANCFYGIIQEPLIGERAINLTAFAISISMYASVGLLMINIIAKSIKELIRMYKEKSLKVKDFLPTKENLKT